MVCPHYPVIHLAFVEVGKVVLGIARLSHRLWSLLDEGRISVEMLHRAEYLMTDFYSPVIVLCVEA